MVRLNLALLVLLIGCALGVVTAQHKARKQFIALQQQQDLARQLDVEKGQLQLEQSTWAMHSRIEKIAASELQMRVPPPARIQLVPPPAQPQERR
ncbi:MAG TPA: cell division protein FtsL [Burkholderiales bacterium]|nr:cell division protein FtsL [Burkholderiales bacterium]